MARKSYEQTMADNIATRLLYGKRMQGRSFPPTAQLRDYVDGFTGGDLHCVALDILTDMVSARLESASEQDRLLAAARRPHGH